MKIIVIAIELVNTCAGFAVKQCYEKKFFAKNLHSSKIESTFAVYYYTNTPLCLKSKI